MSKLLHRLYDNLFTLTVSFVFYVLMIVFSFSCEREAPISTITPADSVSILTQNPAYSQE